jgi:hypothetical protein
LATSVLQTIWSSGTVPRYKVSSLLGPEYPRLCCRVNFLPEASSVLCHSIFCFSFQLGGNNISPEHHCHLQAVREINTTVWEGKKWQHSLLMLLFYEKESSNVQLKHSMTFWDLGNLSSLLSRQVDLKLHHLL